MYASNNKPSFSDPASCFHFIPLHLYPLGLHLRFAIRNFTRSFTHSRTQPASPHWLSFTFFVFTPPPHLHSRTIITILLTPSLLCPLLNSDEPNLSLPGLHGPSGPCKTHPGDFRVVPGLGRLAHSGFARMSALAGWRDRSIFSSLKNRHARPPADRRQSGTTAAIRSVDVLSVVRRRSPVRPACRSQQLAASRHEARSGCWHAGHGLRGHVQGTSPGLADCTVSRVVC